MQVILASASPRRLRLLQNIGFDVKVHPADFVESSGGTEPPEKTVLANAFGKCQAVCAVCGDNVPAVAADTVVVINGMILGKPDRKEAAVEMLRLLSGREHRVLTGVSVGYRGKKLTNVCETRVFFRNLAENKITAYVATVEPLDKAWAYGIQGKGALLVEKIDSCYNNVVGLPLTCLYLMFEKLGVNVEGQQ